jgi:O-antigen/teichoic acid export membrane protein
MSSRTHRQRTWLARAPGLLTLLATTSAAQAIVQGVAFLCGVAVLRSLAPAEYALYTLASAALGSIAVLADGGINTGAVTQGRLVHDDRARLGGVLRTAMALRWRFGSVVLILSAPVLAALLVRHGASAVLAGGLTAATLLVAWTLLASGIFEIAPRLRQNLLPLQTIQLRANALRLAATLLLLALSPTAAAALAATLAAQLWANRRLAALSARHADPAGPLSDNDRRVMLSMVRRVLPGALYFSLSGQIVVWLASIFASTSAVAQIGALGRLAMLLNVLVAACALVVVPRFARLAADPALLRRRFAEIQGLLLAVVAGILLLAWWLPTPFLWILGRPYAGLESEVFLSMLGAGFGLLQGVTYGLSAQRGHVMGPALNIGLSLAMTTGLLLLIDCSTVRGVLAYSAIYGGLQYLMWLVHATATTLRAAPDACTVR